MSTATTSPRALRRRSVQLRLLFATALATIAASLLAAAPAGAQLIVFDGTRGLGGPDQTDLFTIDPAGGGPVQITNDANFYSDPGFSNDGQTIITSGSIGGASNDIFSLPVGGGALTNLTNDPSAAQRGPDVNPIDGRIAFESGAEELKIMNADGSGIEPLGMGLRPNFGPTGKIVFDYMGEIRTINPDGTGATPLTNDAPGEFSSGAAFSNSGTMIAYSKMPGGGGASELWIMNADGSGQQSLGTTGFGPKFSPDDDQLVFSDFGGSSAKLFTLDLSGSAGTPVAGVSAVTATNRTALTDDAAGNLGDMNPDWFAPPDETPPETAITEKPADAVSSPQPTKDVSYSFTGSDDKSAPAALSFGCSTDGGATYAACNSPTTVTLPIDGGTHTFMVRATDEAGNVDPTPATHSVKTTLIDCLRLSQPS